MNVNVEKFIPVQNQECLHKEKTMPVHTKTERKKNKTARKQLKKSRKFKRGRK